MREARSWESLTIRLSVRTSVQEIQGMKTPTVANITNQPSTFNAAVLGP